MDRLNKTAIQAVIFDFDGVIVNSEPLHLKAFQTVLSGKKIELQASAYWDTYIGFDDRDAFQAMFRDHKGTSLDNDQLQDLINEKAEAFIQIVRTDGVEPYPGVGDLLQHLLSSDVPVGIASGALHSDITVILNRLNWTSYFGFIIAADDVQRSKPDPETYLKAFHMIPGSVSAAHVLAVEDTPAGIASARKAGLTVAAITNTLPAKELAEADIIVAGCSELPARLNL